MTPSALELDSIVTVWSQIILREVEEPENSDELNRKLSTPKPRVGMSSGMVKSS